jgi:hypothetical protein
MAGTESVICACLKEPGNPETVPYLFYTSKFASGVCFAIRITMIGRCRRVSLAKIPGFCR